MSFSPCCRHDLTPPTTWTPPPRACSPQVSKARRVASFSASVSSSIGGRTAAAGLAEQLLPVFRMRGGFSAGRVRRNASRTGLRLSRTAFALGDLAGEGEIGVFAHAAVDLGLEQVRRRRAEIEPPAELDDVVEPFLLRRRADQDLVADQPGQPQYISRGTLYLMATMFGEVGDAARTARGSSGSRCPDGSTSRCRCRPAR